MRKLLGITLFVAAAAIFGSCEKKYEYIGEETRVGLIYLDSFTKESNLVVSTKGYRHPWRIGEGVSIFVYFLEDTYGNGKPIWTPLPAKYFIDVQQGNTTSIAEIEYSNAHSLEEVFLTARSFQGLDLFKKVGSGNDAISYTDNLTFKVVYLSGPNPVPFSVASETKEDGTVPYEVLEKQYNLQNAKVARMNPSK
ncbi:hypothetical protein ACYSNM_04405 [Myroides sp. LJL116]